MRELIYTGKRVMEYFQSPYVCVEVLTCCNHILLTFLHPRGFLLDASPQGLQCFSGIFLATFNFCYQTIWSYQVGRGLVRFLAL